MISTSVIRTCTFLQLIFCEMFTQTRLSLESVQLHSGQNLTYQHFITPLLITDIKPLDIQSRRPINTTKFRHLDKLSPHRSSRGHVRPEHGPNPNPNPMT